MPTRLALLAVVALLAVPAFAQTTWTSFEDRRGHAIASDPTSGVLMFGGESTLAAGALLGDTSLFANPGGNAGWARLHPTGSPTARTEHAIASAVGTDDAAIFVLFGGLAQPSGGGTPTPSDQTFVYEGGGWGNTSLAQLHPSARTGHAMVRDTRRNVIVLFGGYSGGNPVDDLWEFEPVNRVWLQPAITGARPPGRFNHCLAYHPGSSALDGRIYLYGGSGFRNDTWEFDPFAGTWTNRMPPAPPPGRTGAAMSFHPLSDQLVLFGGLDNTLSTRSDTWIYNRTINSWIQAAPTNVPPARSQHAMASDQLGNNVVLHGGDDGSGNGVPGTWLWNGANWIAQIRSPSPRTGVAMTYDNNRERHPTFGGRAVPAGNDLDETWELDGLNWRRRSPANSPPARADAGIAHDSNRQRTVLYGGRTGGPCGTLLGDTWEWDGQNWAPRVLVNNPPAAGGVQPVFDSLRNVIWMLVEDQMWRYDGANWTRAATPVGRYFFQYAYDSQRGRFVIAGGFGNDSDESYEWDGTRWRQIAPLPLPRHSGAMAYHAAAGHSILAGGADLVTVFGDSWTWNGTTWSPQASLTGRFSFAAAYDSTRQVVVGFGGFRANQTWSDETIEWSGTSWSTASPAVRPSAREAATLAFDRVRSKVVMFGGSGGTGPLADTWLYDGANWTQIVTPGPSARGRAHMVFDSHTQGLVLFGGLTSLTPVSYDDQTWLFDGATWTLVQPTSRPHARFGHSLVDTGTRTLLWGGSSSRFWADLWEWDGQLWSLVDSGSPGSRKDYGAAYDARRDRVVIFGGRKDCGVGSFLNGTWEWDGQRWLERFPVAVPSPRERAKLSYDSSRGRVVMFGGSDGSNAFSDTWEWDGDNWIQRLPVVSPPSSAGHGLSYDEERRVTVTSGSVGTWDYGPVSPATIETYGIGCAGPNGVPSLSPKPWAGPWLGGRLEVDLIHAPPTALGIFVWGFSDTVWSGLPLPLSLAAFGSPQCSLLASADLTQLFLAGTNPYVSFVLPTDPSITGMRMYAQAGFLLIGSPDVVSNALRMTFGAR